MRHIIQRRYSYIPYPQRMDEPDNPRGKNGTVRSGGCGLCSACMVVDQLTTEVFPVREATQLSMAVGGNHSSGTDMEIFGPVVAEKFNLDFSTSRDINEAIEAVRDGGRVIALVGKTEPQHKGIFTQGGHYIVVIAATKDEVCILDPNWTAKNFKKWEKEGLVRMEGTLVYTTPEILHNEVKTTDPGYYIFRRKKQRRQEGF